MLPAFTLFQKGCFSKLVLLHLEGSLCYLQAAHSSPDAESVLGDRLALEPARILHQCCCVQPANNTKSLKVQ